MDLLRLRSEVGQLRRQTNELAALRRETEQLRANMAAGAPRAAMAQSTPPGSNDVASANAVIFDPTAPVTAKLAALRILRSANARTDGVVKQMLQAFHASDNPDVRADIFRNLSRMTTPELKTPLLQAVSNSNEHPNVRQEAAENMAGFLPDPDVKAWLETLAFSEPDPEVRLAARRSIESYQRYLQRGR
jgi:hypothetical protein